MTVATPAGTSDRQTFPLSGQDGREVAWIPLLADIRQSWNLRHLKSAMPSLPQLPRCGDLVERGLRQLESEVSFPFVMFRMPIGVKFGPVCSPSRQDQPRWCILVEADTSIESRPGVRFGSTSNRTKPLDLAPQCFHFRLGIRRHALKCRDIVVVDGVSAEPAWNGATFDRNRESPQDRDRGNDQGDVAEQSHPRQRDRPAEGRKDQKGPHGSGRLSAMDFLLQVIQERIQIGIVAPLVGRFALPIPGESRGVIDQPV